MVTSNQFTRLQLTHFTNWFPALTWIFVFAFASSAHSDDWPQINGPHRNGVTDNETLLDSWPSEGLKEIWNHPVGQGFSGPVVSNGRVIVFHRPAKTYLVESLDSVTGKLVWNKELPADYNGGGPDGDAGPKSTPLIHDGFVYLLGTGGNLFCLSFENGDIVWQKNVLTDYGSPTGYFGAGSSPIASAGNLILNVGGKDAAVVAFDLKTGDEKWKAYDDRASYSSPVEFDIEGRSVVALITRVQLLGLDAKNGKVVFETPFGKTGTTVNGALPYHFAKLGEDYLFVNASYGVGAKLLKAGSTGGVEEIWANDSSFSSQFSTPVLSDGCFYGTAGRQDQRTGSFRCVEAMTGKVLWTQKKITVGHSILVGDKVLLLDTDGGFHVIATNKTKFEEIYTSKLLDWKSFAMPAISNGLLYARTNADGSDPGELVCVEVGIRSAPK